jgi:uncharacterized protein (DUF58 family)
MPTSRTAVVLIGALVLYFFANQTQVGWLYVMCAVLGGTVLAAGWLSRGMLRTVSASRSLGDAAQEIYEGDDLAVSLRLSAGRASSAQIRLTERCPLAAPDSPQRAMALYVPSLPGGGAVRFEYAVTVDQRGLYEFPPLELASGAPFGFFRRARRLDVPSPALVYPEVRLLSRFDLLDRQFAPQVTRPAAGVGFEVMGLRAYRPGDSPRSIHWRTVARTGQLVSKEYADETQPGVTLALDLFRHPYAETGSKHTPFEWAVKLAASIGDYANRRGYPLTLATNDEALPAPPGAISWYALLQYLARVQPVGALPLAQSLAGVPLQAFVIALLPYSDAGAAAFLRELRLRGARVLAVLFDAESFPLTPNANNVRVPSPTQAGSGEKDRLLSASALAGELAAAGIETRLIRYGEDWAAQLQEDRMFDENVGAFHAPPSHERRIL